MDQYSTLTDIYVHMVVLLDYNDLMTVNNRKTLQPLKQTMHIGKYEYIKSLLIVPCKKLFLYL